MHMFYLLLIAYVLALIVLCLAIRGHLSEAQSAGFLLVVAVLFATVASGSEQRPWAAPAGPAGQTAVALARVANGK